jgi:hypothetical protein
MKAFLQMSTLLLGASIVTFAQAEAHAHAQGHGGRSPLDVFSDVERDAASLEARSDDSYGGKKDHSGGSGWKGGSYEYKGHGSQDGDDKYGDNGYGDSGYGDSGASESTSTVIINITEEGTYGMSTVAAGGEETMTISAVTVSMMGSGQEGAQTSYVERRSF